MTNSRICVTSRNGNWVLVNTTGKPYITNTIVLPMQDLAQYAPMFETALGDFGVYSINDPR